MLALYIYVSDMRLRHNGIDYPHPTLATPLAMATVAVSMSYCLLACLTPLQLPSLRQSRIYPNAVSMPCLTVSMSL